MGKETFTDNPFSAFIGGNMATLDSFYYNKEASNNRSTGAVL